MIYRDIVKKDLNRRSAEEQAERSKTVGRQGMLAEIREVKTRRDLKTFIYLPAKIHQDHPRWVPPIYGDEWRYFNPRKNLAFRYSEAVLALAFQNGRAIGRIMGIINHRYNELRKERHARFGCLECPNEQDVAHGLLAFVEDWARGKGMVKVTGPMGFSDQDPEGFLIEGFEHEPTIATYYNLDYMNHLLEKDNYAKEVDYVVYRVDLTKGIPEFYKRIYQRAVNQKVCQVLDLSRRRQLKPYVRPVFRLMNECFAELYGFQPMEEEEMEVLAKRYLTILDPRFVMIAVKNQEVIGFNISMPNLAEGLRKARGRLFPLGIFKILREAKKTKQLDSLIGGIKKEYRGRGVDVLMGYRTIDAALRAGFEYADSHHELEDNAPVRAEMEKLGGYVYKRFRIYQKTL